MKYRIHIKTEEGFDVFPCESFAELLEVSLTLKLAKVSHTCYSEPKKLVNL